MIKIIDRPFELYFIYPSIFKGNEELFSGGRKSIELRANTGFKFLKSNYERPNWLEVSILGIGLAI